MDRVWAEADFIVEGEYFTGAQEHLYIENNGMIAVSTLSPDYRVGFSAVPLLRSQSLRVLCGLPEEKVRVVQTETGGAFGRQSRIPVHDRGACRDIGNEIGTPVKMFTIAWKIWLRLRNGPIKTRHRTALSKDGRILGGEIDLTSTRAVSTLPLSVLSRATIHAGGPYFWPSVRIRSKAVATDTPPHGCVSAIRSAAEPLRHGTSHGPHRERTLDLVPEKLPRRNFLRPGQTTTNGTSDPRTTICQVYWTNLWRTPAMRKKNGKIFLSKTKQAPIRRGWELLPSCTVRDLPAPVNGYLDSGRRD